ncbi:MAG: sulfite exporter TauE/SafE family protein [Clostridia bacterium]|nr:sulfite exporter TauE/SafE family protein [Clostridia bacterium]
MKKFFICVLAFVSGIINGLFATGGGIVALPMLYLLLKDKKQAHNSVVFFVLPMAIISACVYQKSIDTEFLLKLCAGACFGGALGAFLSRKLSLKFIKILFGALVLYSGVRSVI